LGFLRVRSLTFGIAGRRDRRCMRLGALLTSRIAAFALCCCLAVAALTQHVRKLPATLKRSLTWDRGLEVAKHKDFTVATDVQVYFCDPQSPWQRGTNENTNLLLRQYFPRCTDLSGYSQEQLDQVSLLSNQRPRKTLGSTLRQINFRRLLRRPPEPTAVTGQVPSCWSRLKMAVKKIESWQELWGRNLNLNDPTPGFFGSLELGQALSQGRRTCER
jgi:hypothetical protein